MSARRFFVVAKDVAPIGYDTFEAALLAARHYGEGAEIIDTKATPYHPMVQRIEKGEPVYLEFGAWDTRAAPHLNLIEAVKKGHAPIVRAFLAKGGDAKVRDGKGATALHWAVARDKREILEIVIAAGAELSARDDRGDTALALAKRKGLSETETLLRHIGAVE
ncbi:MAG: ankyrin repeat domain-containing protein [Alphaproteobacteria bacterium]|nr:ankyrin repeat domain-containing protein [Alphaproteobacteria bacterium]